MCYDIKMSCRFLAEFRKLGSIQGQMMVAMCRPLGRGVTCNVIGIGQLRPTNLPREVNNLEIKGTFLPEESYVQFTTKNFIFSEKI